MKDCLFIHVTLVPFLSGSNEPKSKPTQHSVKELRGLGISPDIIVARVDQPMDDDIKRKISMFCTVPEDCVIENRTLPVLYQAPMMLEHSKDFVVILWIKTVREFFSTVSGLSEQKRTLSSEYTTGTGVKLNCLFSSNKLYSTHIPQWLSA